MKIEIAEYQDLMEILQLQKLCFKQEAELYDDYLLQPLIETIKDVQNAFNQGVVFFKLTIDALIIGSVRAYTEHNTCYIGKLIVHPLYQNKGFGSQLIHAAEQHFSQSDRYELFTGSKSEKNLYLYAKLGYREFERVELARNVQLIFFEKNMLIF